jgi:hypothetical protein
VVNGENKEDNMASNSVTDTALLDILSKLEPGQDVDESLRKLLLAKARNDLIKHRLMDQGFRKEYGTDFFTFKSSDRMKQPSFKVEQDYFDWELAVTMIDDLEDMLKVLQGVAA